MNKTMVQFDAEEQQLGEDYSGYYYSESGYYSADAYSSYTADTVSSGFGPKSPVANKQKRLSFAEPNQQPIGSQQPRGGVPSGSSDYSEESFTAPPVAAPPKPPQQTYSTRAPKTDAHLPPPVPEMTDKMDELRQLRDQNNLIRNRWSDLIDELQQTIAQKTLLEGRANDAVYRHATDTDHSVSGGPGGGLDVFSMGDAELQKRYFEVEAQNTALKEERVLRGREIEKRDNDIVELKAHIRDLLDDVDHDEMKKAQRKNWWGTKKKYKAGEAAHTANDIRHDLDFDEDDTKHQLDKVKAKDVKKHGALAEVQKNEILSLKRHNEKLTDQVRVANEERIRLEKERARLEGETLVFQRERWSDKDRLNKLETSNELLKNQQRHAATETALTYSRAIEIPLPNNEGSTVEQRQAHQIRMMEDALRRSAVQRDQLADMMDNMEKQMPAVMGNDELRAAAVEISQLNQTIAKLSKERADYMAEARRLQALMANSENDNSELKATVQHLSHNLSKAANRDKDIKARQAAMIGQALSANEDLAAQLAKTKINNVDRLMSAQGEIKTVFAGRANEPSTQYAINRKLYPTVTAKRYFETHPTIEKGSMVTSCAQTDPIMVSLPEERGTFALNSLSPRKGISDDIQVRSRPFALRNQYSYDSFISDESYAYTYIEEDIVVPSRQHEMSPAKKSNGIQILVGGHQGLPAALRHDNLKSNQHSVAC